jgi:hypothetical protein
MMPDANQVCIAVAAAPSPSIFLPYQFEFIQKVAKTTYAIPKIK